jgi:hypothetical protein
MNIGTKLVACGLAAAALTAGAFTPADAASPSASASTGWAVRYVGGTAKPADAGARSLVIGVTNPVGLTGFPASSATIKAVQSYVN